LRIAIFTAAVRDSRAGNWVTATRWQQLLRSAGHHVSILHDDDEVHEFRGNVIIGLHARRSSTALLRFRKQRPQSVTLVALTGTDLYRDLSPTRKHHPALASKSLDHCDRIILLQPLMLKGLKRKWKTKSSVVMMDVTRQRKTPPRSQPRQTLSACVVGHMRYEKDPLRAAMAVRSLPPEVQIKVAHAGKALTDSLESRATDEAAKNENWSWLGSISHGKGQQLMRSSDVLINSSRAEGAPNVLFEAISWRLPIIASKIDGHQGVLGKQYPGYFTVGDTKGLRKLLIKCCQSKNFYSELVQCIDALARDYAPGNELKSLLSAIAKARSNKASR